ncbi:leucine-rich repeat-containing protein 71 isoform X2 [Heliangelus exortis]|uniref:leucine-rich repeat-containing protein 71 isoform X2 n=1 Tax=Heliangelus exortis TaxID=472823 RepID=UPI003A91F758
MRRRGDRTPKEEEGERKGEQSAEEYQCTGVLELDFPELCARAGVTGVPKVTPRPSPSFPADDEPEEPGLGGVLARIHHKYRPLQPRLEVEGDPQDPRTARAIFLRGWKLEEEVLGVFSRCLPSLAGLQALHLWNVPLPEGVLPALVALLGRCPRLRTFSLEGTPVPEAALPTLMGSNSTLSHLSLRCSQLGDAAAQLLGGLLSTPSGPPARLVSLVLSFNRISDLGVSYIAKGLRLNRSLLSLSLANNDIGDSGATSLAEVLGPFPLTHQEVVQRRRLLLALGRPLTTLKDQKERTQSLRGVPDRLLPGKLGKTTPKKKEPPRKEETRQPKKGAGSTRESAAAAGGGAGGAGGEPRPVGESGAAQPQPQPQPHLGAGSRCVPGSVGAAAAAAAAAGGVRAGGAALPLPGGEPHPPHQPGSREAPGAAALGPPELGGPGPGGGGAGFGHLTPPFAPLPSPFYRHPK